MTECCEVFELSQNKCIEYQKRYNAYYIYQFDTRKPQQKAWRIDFCPFCGKEPHRDGN